MRSSSKVLFAALLAVLVMSAAGSVASANRSLSLNNGGVRVFSYSGRYTFTDPEGAFRVVCEGLAVITASRDAIPKVPGTELGRSELTLRSCSGGTVRVLEPRGFTARYTSFSGTLPRIATITIEVESGARGGFLLEVFFGIARCLYGGRIRGIGTFNAAGELINNAVESAPIRASVNLGGVECPEGMLRGSGVPLAGAPALRIRLV